MSDDRRHTIAEHISSPPSEITGPRWIREREIARGGMGRIELVFDRTLQRRLAMKCILPNQTDNIGDFIREARITGRIDHPHIVPVHELSRDENDLPFFTMKLVKGKTLHDLMYDNRPLEDHARLLDLVEVLIKVCDALDYAHSCGVIHRDLKPENVMVGDFGEVYLMDWGVARIFDPERFFTGQADLPLDEQGFLEDTDEGYCIGTPEYMSPEQAEALNSTLDERTDVWALGVLLYETICRRLPFAAKDAYDVFDKVIAGQYQLPSEAGHTWVPGRLESIIRRALQTDREQRYRTVRAFKRDLQRFLRGNSEFPIARYNAGDVIVKFGDVGQEAFVIASGKCSVWAETDTGPVLLGYMHPGDVFGEAAVFAEGTRAATVKADEETTCYRVSKDVIDAEIESQKPWIAAFIRTLAERFRQNSERLTKLLAPPDPLAILGDAFMYANAFGTRSDDSLTASLSAVVKHLSERNNLPEDRVKIALNQLPDVTLDLEHDAVEIRNVSKLRSMLA